MSGLVRRIQKFSTHSVLRKEIPLGLTVQIKGYSGAYDCGYITYGNFMMELIKTAYGRECYEIFQRSLITSKPFTDEDEKVWEAHKNDDLELWIWHSDCDGKFSYQECRKIYNAIKDLEMQNFFAHDYGDMKQYNMLERWKDMFHYCAKRRVNMYFR